MTFFLAAVDRRFRSGAVFLEANAWVKVLTWKPKEVPMSIDEPDPERERPEPEPEQPDTMPGEEPGVTAPEPAMLPEEPDTLAEEPDTLPEEPDVPERERI